MSAEYYWGTGLVYPEAVISGYFGPLTEQAVTRFQVKHNLAAKGDPAWGYVGPRMRALLLGE